MKKIVCLLLVMILTVICIPVHAEESFYAGQDLSLDKEYSSTVFAAGNNIKATGKVDGISFIAGNNISVENERDYLFVAGNLINIKKVTTKDAFIAGSSITIEESRIRDLYATADTVTVNSDIDGKAYIGATTVTINSTIKGNITVAADVINLGEKANIEGTLKYPETAKLNKEAETKIAKENKYEVKKETTSDKVKKFFYDFITTVLSMILIGLLLLSLNGKTFEKFAKINKEPSSIIKTCLVGFAFLIIVPILSLILICSRIGLPLGIICMLLYGIMIYLSVLPTAYFLGKWLAKDKVDNKYSLLILSIIVIYVLKLIPFIGGIVSFLTLCFGLGAYAKIIKEKSEIK